MHLSLLKKTKWLQICSHNGDVFAIEPPLFVELRDYRNRTWYSKETQPQVLQNLQWLKQEQQYMFHYSLNQGETD